MVNKDEIQVGDRVRITRYIIGRLYPQTACNDPRTVGMEGVVTKIENRQRYTYNRRSWVIRLFATPTEGRPIPVVMIDEFDMPNYEDMELVSKGDGVCIPGVHYPLTEYELRQQRWAAWQVKCFTEWDHKATGQGFSNAPTFLAHLYLSNESAFWDWCKYNRRKDGTINPNKVKKWFYDQCLEIDDWAYVPPFDIPAEFATERIPNRPRVDWQEVADMYADKGAAK